MKITIEMNNKKYCVEEDHPFGDANVEEAVEMFKGLLVCAGYHPCNVDDIMETESPWFSEKEKQDNMQGHIKPQSQKYQEGYAKGWDEAQHQMKVQDYQDNLYKQEEQPDEDDIFS